jgi:RNA polymerase sigma-70 factor (ECF subfamily)
MEPSDEDLVQRVVCGADERAFDVLVRRHQAAVRSLLRRLCRNAALADELAQETFIKAYSRLGRFSRSGSFRAWLGGIAYREFLVAARTRRREALRLDVIAEDAQRALPEPGAHDLSIDLDRALSRLPDNQRCALVLSAACGMSHAEIAEAMKAPLGTVKTWIAAARRTAYDRLKADEKAADNHDR